MALTQPASFLCTLLCFVLTEKQCHFSLYILKMNCNNGSHRCLMYCWNKFLEFMLLCKGQLKARFKKHVWTLQFLLYFFRFSDEYRRIEIQNTEDNWKACIWVVVFLIPSLKWKFSSPNAFEITEANECSASQNLSLLIYILQSRSSVPMPF